MLYVPNVVAEYGNIRTIAGVAPRHNAVTPSFFTIFFVVSKPFWNVNFPPSDWIWNSSFTLSIGAVENLDNAPAHAPAPNRSIVVGSLLKISFLCCTSSSFGGFLRTKRRNIFFFLVAFCYLFFTTLLWIITFPSPSSSSTHKNMTITTNNMDVVIELMRVSCSIYFFATLCLLSLSFSQSVEWCSSREEESDYLEEKLKQNKFRVWNYFSPPRRLEKKTAHTTLHIKFCSLLYLSCATISS